MHAHDVDEARSPDSPRAARGQTAAQSAVVGPVGLIALQRAAGNSAVARLLGPLTRSWGLPVQRCPGGCPSTGCHHDHDDRWPVQRGPEDDDVASPAVADGVEAQELQGTSGAGAGSAPKPLPIGSRPTPSSTTKQFDDCNAAAAWLNTGQFAGDARPSYTPSVGQVTVTKQGKDFKAAVKITWSLDPSSTIELIEPVWPNMTDADKAAVAKFKAALRAHEDRHFAETDAVIAKRPKMLTATGPTQADAVANLQTKATTEQADTQAAIDKATQDYDTKTRNGANQAAVGGENVHLACPPPPTPKP